MNIGIIILAAGNSSRLGYSKQLVELNGENLLNKVISTAIKTNIKDIAVVLGANYQSHFEAIKHSNISIIENKDWAKGIGNSIKLGFFHLLSTSQFPLDRVLILLCDQVLLNTEYLQTIIKTSRQFPKSIIASKYIDTIGVPALFPKSHFADLLNLADHEGAKKILQQHEKKCITLEFKDGAIDLDTHDDYIKILEILNK